MISCRHGKHPMTALRDPRDNGVALSGSDWFLRADEGLGYEGVMGTPGGWCAARVPGNIQADLERNRLLTPLWYGTGDNRLMEESIKDWWYRRDFQVPKEYAGRRLTLVFDGVDYACEVWVNACSSNAGRSKRWAKASSRPALSLYFIVFGSLPFFKGRPS